MDEEKNELRYFRGPCQPAVVLSVVMDRSRFFAGFICCHCHKNFSENSAFCALKAVLILIPRVDPFRVFL